MINESHEKVKDSREVIIVEMKFLIMLVLHNGGLRSSRLGREIWRYE